MGHLHGGLGTASNLLRVVGVVVGRKQERHVLQRCVANRDIQQIWLTIKRPLHQCNKPCAIGSILKGIDQGHKVGSVVLLKNIRQVFGGHISKYFRE